MRRAKILVNGLYSSLVSKKTTKKKCWQQHIMIQVNAKFIPLLHIIKLIIFYQNLSHFPVLLSSFYPLSKVYNIFSDTQTRVILIRSQKKNYPMENLAIKKKKHSNLEDHSRQHSQISSPSPRGLIPLIWVTYFYIWSKGGPIIGSAHIGRYGDACRKKSAKSEKKKTLLPHVSAPS